jgi:hypothetical protein
MKKICTLLASALIIVGGFSLQSCRKCTTCSYTYVLGGITKTYAYAEVCGNSDDINYIEDLCAQESAAVGGNCFCD